MQSETTTSNEKRVAALQQQLLTFFSNDKSRLKSFAQNCELIGFKLRDNIDAIVEFPEHFSLLISYEDLGILPKLAGSLNILKGKK